MTLSFSIGVAGGGSDALNTAVPVLAGEETETIMAGAVSNVQKGDISLWRGPGRLAGFSRIDPGGDLEGATRRLYGDLLVAARGLTIYRIWNFVPEINRPGRDGLENYRAFCAGRSDAFERVHGPEFQGFLPAASAVGGPGDTLTVGFIAGEEPSRNVENPLQVPAYRYPAEHGPRAPSFARATVVEKKGSRDIYISGTSSIAGHKSVSPGDTPGQVECTLENLRLISTACGLGVRLGAGNGCARHFKVYLRRAADLPLVSRELGKSLLGSGDRVSYLEADICRSELNVEIEVAVRGAASA